MRATGQRAIEKNMGRIERNLQNAIGVMAELAERRNTIIFFYDG